jgi:hypothetical protein
MKLKRILAIVLGAVVGLTISYLVDPTFYYGADALTWIGGGIAIGLSVAYFSPS